MNAFDPGLVPGTGLALARLVTDPALARTTGAHVVRRAETRPSTASYDVGAQEALHRDSLELIAELRGPRS